MRKFLGKYLPASLVLAFFAMILLTCGGGGGDGGDGTALDNVIPAAPSLTSATAGNAKVTLVWGAVTGATSYNVYYGTATGVTKDTGTKAAGVTSPYDVSGLTNGTSYFFIVTALGAGGESAESNELSATPTAPAAAFSQADLTGTWNLQALDTNSSGTENRWYRGTATVDASGNLTFTSFESSDVSFVVPPAGTVQWTIDGSGLVSESGSWAIANVHMTMTSNKNFMAGTAGNTFHELRIAQKIVPGTVYGNADLQNKSFVIHGLIIGTENLWSHQDGSIDASGMISTANDWTPSGNQGAVDNVGTISLDGSGTATIDMVPGFKGFLSPDKKMSVRTSTETGAASTWYQLMIIQISGQTYTASDLVGTERGHNLGVGNENFWLHFTDTIAVGGVITFSSVLDSSGATPTPPPVVGSISSSGTITVPTDPSFHGTMSDDKKFAVATMTSGPGIYLLSITTR